MIENATIPNKNIHIWLRAEIKEHEYRTPLTPSDAKYLINLGFKITVEKSSNRCYTDDTYSAVGCIMVANGSWINAPIDAFVLGIKELGPINILHHRHIYFSHCLKRQIGSVDLLTKFVKAGGMIYDIEYITDENDVRLASFGKSAGIAGTLIGIDSWISKHVDKTIVSYESPIYNLENFIKKLAKSCETINIKIAVIGCNGRVGSGVLYVLDKLGLIYDKFDKTSTQSNISLELLNYDIMINCIVLNKYIEPFITFDVLKLERRLTMCIDISCDYTHPYNPIAVYNQSTSFDKPLLTIKKNPDFDIISIDNLPSVIPLDSSIMFSSQLVKLLEQISPEKMSEPWIRSANKFKSECNFYGLSSESIC